MSRSSESSASKAGCGCHHPRLVLDHLTAVEAPPDRLAELAAEAGFSAIAPFLHGMPGTLPLPDYDLVQDGEYRRSLRCHLRELNIAIDLVYPFTMSQRHIAEDHLPAIEAAAELGASAINVLNYDRDPSRREDQMCRLVELAVDHGLAVSLEFFPPSRVGDLDTALALMERAGSASQAGITLDLLHLHRSGWTLSDLRPRHWDRVHFVQLCDGAAKRPREELDFEAAFDRLLPGEGSFDLGPVARFRPDLPLTLEIPREAARLAGSSAFARVKEAMAAALPVIGKAG